MDTNGIITTVAGGGTGGDNVPAVQARITNPSGPVAFDASGNYYIAEYGAQRIRKVAANGIITTVAGTGTAGFSGDGGLATSAMLFFPLGVALDASGALFIVDRSQKKRRSSTCRDARAQRASALAPEGRQWVMRGQPPGRPRRSQTCSAVGRQADR